MVTLPRLAAPWYLHPAEFPEAWARLGLASDVAFAVANVEDGPGLCPDPSYSEALARTRCIPWIGYVDVGYGMVPRDRVRAAAEAWREWYGVDAIMLDQVPSSPVAGMWSLDVVAQLRADGVRRVVANPGTVPHADLLDCADVTCVFEGRAADYVRTRFPAWLSDTPTERCWHLLHTCHPAAEQWIRQLAGLRGAGYVWTTPGALPNPWRVLPKRW